MKNTITILLSLLISFSASAQNSVKYLSDLTPSDKHAAYFFPQYEKSFSMGGVSYTHGFYMYTTQGPTKHGYAEFSLKGAYKTLNFILGTSPYRTNLTKKGIFAIYLDGRKVVDKIVDPHGVQERMSLDVSGVNSVRFEIIEGEVFVCVAEPTLWTASQKPRETGEICPVKGDKPVKLTSGLLPYQHGPRHWAVVANPSSNNYERASLSLNSKKYDNGILFDAAQGIMSTNLCTSHFNLGGRFSKLSLLYGPGDSSRGTIGKGWFVIKCDGKILTEIEVDEGAVAKRAVFDISGCRQLTFETENETGTLDIVATEMIVYPDGFEPEEVSAVSAEAAKWPDVCPLMSTIVPYAVGGGVTRESSVFDGRSEHITFSMGGTKFSEGLVLRASSNVLNDNTRAHAIFNLEKQFDYISFTTGWVSQCGVLKNDTLRVYADDKIVFEMPQVATSPNRYYEVPVDRCEKLMFELRGRSNLTHPSFGVADIVLYRGKPVPNDLFVHPTPELPDEANLIDLGAPYVHYVPTMKDWRDKIFYDGTTQRRYFELGSERITKGFMLQTSVHLDLETGPGSDPGVGVMAAGMGASLMVGSIGGVTVSAVFPFGCLLMLASGGTAMESSCAAFNTYGAYDYVTFTVASLDPGTLNRKETLIIGGDGQEITRLEVYEKMEPRTFTVPLNSCGQLMFWLKCGDNTSGKYVFYDLRLGRGKAPETAVPVAGASKTSVAASVEPYAIPVCNSEWTGTDWEKPSTAYQSQSVNEYFKKCHELKNRILKYYSEMRTDYKTTASQVQSGDGKIFREIMVKSSYGETFTFSEMLQYDRQVLKDIKSFKMDIAGLSIMQASAMVGLSEMTRDLLSCTKEIKLAAAMTSSLKKQLDALESDKKAEVKILENLVSSGLDASGIASDDTRIYVR